MKEKISNYLVNLRCKSEEERAEIRDEYRIRAAINKMREAEYIIALFKQTKREL
jgi:hypothetical protein